MTTPATQLPPFPQQLPTSQGAWQQLINVMQQWQGAINATLTLPTWAAPTLLNGWVYYSAPYNIPGYALDASGRVWCRGLVGGGTTTDGTIITTLPYAPLYRCLTLAQAYNGASYAPVRLDVDQSGNVLLLDAPAFSGSYWVSLDQLNYSTLP